MTTIAEVRRTNMELLIAQCDSADEFAARIESSPVYVSQLRTKAADSDTGTPRGMGSKLARRIERAFDKPEGWMDEAHPEGVSVAAPQVALVMADALRYLGKAERHQVLDFVRFKAVEAGAHGVAERLKQYGPTIDLLDNAIDAKKQ